MNFNLKLGPLNLSVGKTALSPDMAAWVRAEDVDAGGTGAKMVSPYSQSAWVYIAVSILAKHVSQIPFRISRVGGNSKRSSAQMARAVRSFRSSRDPEHRKFIQRALAADVLESGAVIDLFKQPHPSLSGKLFWEMVVTWSALRGEFFILPLDTSDGAVDLAERGARVQRMVTLPTELFWHIVTGYELVAWRYTGSPLLTPIPSSVLLPGEVIHCRTPNPYLYWRGMSPLIVAMQPAQSDYAGEAYLKGLWVNNADTGVVVTTDQILNEEQRKAIEVALRERKRKAGTADRPLFLFGGAKVEKPTLSLLDMQFLETRKFLRSEIFSIFHVPPTLAGYTEDVNDGGAGGSLDATKASFIESTITDICVDLETAVDPIIKTFGDDLVGWFDIDSLPIMQAQRRARWDTATKMFAIGVPLNDISTALDLGLPDYPWGKNGYLPFSVQPAEALGTEPAPNEDDPKEPEAAADPDDANNNAGKSGSDPLTRMAGFLKKLSAQDPKSKTPSANLEILWHSHINARRKQVNLFKSKVGRVLNDFRGKTLAKLEEIHLEKSANRLGDIRSLVDLIFQQHEFGASLFAQLQAPITGTLQTAGDELRKELGLDDPWQMPPQKVQDFLNSRQQPIMGVGGTVRDQLNTSLQEGTANGETTAELAGRVKAVFNNLNAGEALRVARTEVNLAYNDARHDAMQDAGIEYKAWLSSHGPHVRPAHAAAEEFYVDAPIPLEQPFIVMGEQLMYPGDSSLGASPGNVINCQCIQLAAQPKGETATSLAFNICGLGELTFKKP